ncbi:phosphatase PAP2 family protein [Martelella soudanensis]|uniref:phosphatase PAP2 family protein n=1 Tax=unclassified Martelella TaxID=2629616 RepID=UPI001FEF3C10|nr:MULTISPECIES: phosphatase PAP2 family protein [unclassified Martelella]
MRRAVNETGTAAVQQHHQWLENLPGRLGAMQPLKAAFILLLALWLLLLVFFYLFPGIDIAASRAFFHQTGCSTSAPAGRICGSFPIAADALLGFLREVIFYLPIILGLTIIYRLIIAWSHHGATYDKALANKLMAGLVALILGPGLLVNTVLKEISHRPRPRNTDIFGGDLGFVPAGDFSGACQSNCSFVSGEAAGAGWLFCYAIFLVPERFRLLLTPPLLALSLVSPAMRLAYGGHYLSDIILGWLASVVVFIGTLYIFTRKEHVGPLRKTT